MKRVHLALPFKEHRYGQLVNWFPYLEGPEPCIVDRLQEHGIYLTDNRADADLIVFFEFNYDELKHLQVPKIYLYGHDEAALIWKSRTERITDPFVKKVVVPNYYYKHSYQNVPHYEGTHHGTHTYWHARSVNRPDKGPAPLEPIDEALLEQKIVVQGSMLWTEFYGYCLQENAAPSPDRCIDVNLLGSVDTYNRWSVRHHRSLALQAVHDLPQHLTKLVGGSASHSKTEHFASLQRSRICIAPWGYGETTARDFQGIAAGCVTIKPASGYMRTNPDFYDGSWQSIVWCEPGFADLADRVHGILLEWSDVWYPKICEDYTRLQAIRGNAESYYLEFADLIIETLNAS